MKLLITLFIGILSLLPYDSQIKITPERNPQIKRLEAALKQGSSKELFKFMEETVEIKLGNSRGDYSKKQAEIIIRDFFKKFPPENFEIVHQGELSGRIWFLIGNYKSKNVVFRTLIKSKVGNNNQLTVYTLELTKEQINPTSTSLIRTYP